ncbi:MAG: Sec-independent protein translocase protein TatB [Steroidobacteraceae bacterium]|jgi:sec-independent protein translocase protein TatB
MLDFGFSEILLTSAIALVVLGPEKLPKVARQVGNWMGRARLMARQLSEQLEREVNAEELLKQQTKISMPTSPAVLPAPTEPAEAEAVPPARREPHPTSAAAMHPTSAAAMHPATPPPQTSAEPQQSTQ